jgi:hypothetical protein
VASGSRAATTLLRHRADNPGEPLDEQLVDMTRSKELRRIHAAIAHRNEAELKWALAQLEIRKRFMTGHSSKLYQLEKQIRVLWEEIADESD